MTSARTARHFAAVMTNTKVLQQQLNFLAPSARILQGDGRLESVPLNDDLRGGWLVERLVFVHAYEG